MIDLHTHSNHSDGSDSPSELAAKAARAGLAAVALTDHDTTDSAPEFAGACAALGVEPVVGVEISLIDPEHPRAHGPRAVHVLAYFCPLDEASGLQRLLARMRADRVARNRALVERLRELGFERLSYDDVVARAHHEQSAGRPHVAAAMFDLHPERVGEQTPENWRRLFDEWLGDRGRAYLPKTDLTIEDAVAGAAGSATVFAIAHPHLNYLDEPTVPAAQATLPGVVASLRERGFAGVEAHYGGLAPEMRTLLVRLARDAGMVPTGGSDYHGIFKEDVALGVGQTGDLRVPDEVLDELKARR